MTMRNFFGLIIVLLGLGFLLQRLNVSAGFGGVTATN